MGILKDRKCNKLANKYNKKINKIYEYIQLFEGPLAPRGDGARYEAGREFHELIFKLNEEIVKAPSEDDVMTLFIILELLIELVERVGLDKIDLSPEVYIYGEE